MDLRGAVTRDGVGGSNAEVVIAIGRIVGNSVRKTSWNETIRRPNEYIGKEGLEGGGWGLKIERAGGKDERAYLPRSQSLLYCRSQHPRIPGPRPDRQREA